MNFHDKSSFFSDIINIEAENHHFNHFQNFCEQKKDYEIVPIPLDDFDMDNLLTKEIKSPLLLHHFIIYGDNFVRLHWRVLLSIDRNMYRPMNSIASSLILRPNSVFHINNQSNSYNINKRNSSSNVNQGNQGTPNVIDVQCATFSFESSSSSSSSSNSTNMKNDNFIFMS